MLTARSSIVVFSIVVVLVVSTWYLVVINQSSVLRDFKDYFITTTVNPLNNNRAGQKA